MMMFSSYAYPVPRQLEGENSVHLHLNELMPMLVAFILVSKRFLMPLIVGLGQF